MNPYSCDDFFQFFITLFSRMGLALCQKLPIGCLVSDEIQLLSLVVVGLLGAIFGTFLVLRRLSMVANALSHTLLLAVVVSFIILYIFGAGAHLDLLSLPLLMVASLACAFLTTSLASLLKNRARLPEDASIALVFSTLFAFAIILLSVFSKNLHLGLELIVGNVDAVNSEDLTLLFTLLVAGALFVILFFKELTLTTFDSLLANCLGFSTTIYHHLLMGFVALSLVCTFQVVGVLMSLAFFIGPPLIARLIARRLVNVILLAIGVAILSSLLGVALSRHLLNQYQLPLSTSGIVVAWIFVFYMFALLFSPHRGLIVTKQRQRSLIEREKKSARQQILDSNVTI